MLEIAVVFSGALAAGVLSGISGGGAGMLMVPLMIFVGLPPQQAVATNKMNGIGASLGGVLAFRKSGHIRMDIVKVMIPVVVAIAIATPFVFVAIDSTFMQLAIGTIMIALVPTLFIKKKLKPAKSARHSQVRRISGFGAYSAVTGLQALFGSGVGTLALFVQTLLFGTTKLEASATKRVISAIATPLVFLSLFIAGFVVLSYGIAAMAGSFIGTNLGSKIAIRKGDKFVSVAMAIIASISAVVLIVTA